MTRIILTFVDVMLTMITFETGASAIAYVFIELIYAMTSVAWVSSVDLTFVNLFVTVFSSITRLTFA